MTIIGRPNPHCEFCNGSGTVYDMVDYGSTTVSMPSQCECVEDNRYRAERLPNGLVHVFDYATKWSALYTPAGDFHSGEITIPFVEVTK